MGQTLSMAFLCVGFFFIRNACLSNKACIISSSCKLQCSVTLDSELRLFDFGGTFGISVEISRTCRVHVLEENISWKDRLKSEFEIGDEILLKCY